MKTLGRRRGSTIGIVLLGYSLIAACTPQSGPTTSNNRGSHAEATYKTAPNEVVSQGDKALAEKEYLRALNRYEEASKEVNEKIQASALNRMGELYERGLGVGRDYKRSYDLYQKSAILGNHYGQANLANGLFFGVGTERNLPEALVWAQKGAEGDVPMAINQVGWQFLNGMGVHVDATEAQRQYAHSAALGDPTGEFQLGWVYAHVDPIDYQLAMQWYKKASDQNSERAESNIGYLYENGLGVARDYAHAASWYQVAATAGFPRAQFHLGSLYDLGHGVPHDAAKARELMQKAADGGDDEASHWLSTH